MSVPQTMVGVRTYVPTQWDLSHAAVELGLCLPAMDWAVMVRKGEGRREGSEGKGRKRRREGRERQGLSEQETKRAAGNDE